MSADSQKRTLEPNKDGRAAAPAEAALSNVRGLVDDGFAAGDRESGGGETDEGGKSVAIGLLAHAAKAISNR